MAMEALNNDETWAEVPIAEFAWFGGGPGLSSPCFLPKKWSVKFGDFKGV